MFGSKLTDKVAFAAGALVGVAAARSLRSPRYDLAGKTMCPPRGSLR